MDLLFTSIKEDTEDYKELNYYNLESLNFKLVLIIFNGQYKALIAKKNNHYVYVDKYETKYLMNINILHIQKGLGWDMLTDKIKYYHESRLIKKIEKQYSEWDDNRAILYIFEEIEKMDNEFYSEFDKYLY